MADIAHRIYNFLPRIIQKWFDSFEGLSKNIWLLSLITLVNRSGTVIIIFLAIYLTEQLGFTKSEAGIVIGCFGLGSMIGSYIGGKLTDKIGYYKVMFFSMFSVGFFFFGMAYVKDFYPFCAMVIATSAVGDMYNPASQASIAAYSKPENRSRALSLIRLAINLGFAVGSSAVGFIAGSYGYFWLFMIDGGTCIASAILFLFVMKNIKEIPSKLEEDEITSINNDIRPPHKDTWYMLFLICLALCSLPFFQLFTSYPVFTQDILGFSEAEYGAIMAFNGLLLFFFEMPIVEKLSNKGKDMKIVAQGALLIALSFFAFTVLGLYAWVAVISMVFIVFGEILNFPFSTTIALSRSHPSNRGIYMGYFSMTFSLVFIFAPWGGMRIVEVWGYQTLWLWMGIAALLGTIGLALLSSSYQENQES